MLDRLQSVRADYEKAKSEYSRIRGTFEEVLVQGDPEGKIREWSAVSRQVIHEERPVKIALSCVDFNFLEGMPIEVRRSVVKEKTLVIEVKDSVSGVRLKETLPPVYCLDHEGERSRSPFTTEDALRLIVEVEGVSKLMQSS